MEPGRRFTHKYSFLEPKLEELRKLSTLVMDGDGVAKRHGRVLYILSTKVVEGLLNTLVQFYDMVYRCFTFSYYQLLPTLEEYANLVGIPVSNKISFTSLEEIPKSKEIASILHLKKTEATYFATAGSMAAFEDILALLVYGLVLFPNINNFVDVNAIWIFMIKKPILTLLGNTYHSIHLRTDNRKGIIVCCASFLYRWFISHLLDTRAFWDNKECLRWSQRIIYLTSYDIEWYSHDYFYTKIIDSCGRFSNVPLLGTQGGINYNPILARRQMGYPLNDKPGNLLVEGFFSMI
ncbi:uncharacterized protein LOC131631654 [Vicia villosa]|uniref:uncharacterized protein LOC131631654 n=1 Tax=Vicia villosa TaxID=3911 RepID=UPI00273A7B8D|nr:uncharacterized protein LOC131631654 [Vicia villosa]